MIKIGIGRVEISKGTFFWPHHRMKQATSIKNEMVTCSVYILLSDFVENTVELCLFCFSHQLLLKASSYLKKER
ncbi:MAG: hypothetical protein KTM48_00470, partial [Wolbachia endosymbiont of Pissodes strobi]|nr:hypothetical protein [Wolbachia endosymbiont of Pissodes strobi]